MRLTPGRVVAHRHFTRDELAWAPMTRVVRHDERGLLLWLSSGSPVVRQVSRDGATPRDMPFAAWTTVAKTIRTDVYRGPATLKLIPPGAAHAVWWLFDPDGAFAAWYVNLEEPAVIWNDGALAGVDVTDQDLDIRVWPDRTWEWKDDDELAERMEFPDHYWVHDAAAVRDEGRRVIPRIEKGEYPFDGTWCDFRPDPGWRWPETVPEGWDRPRVVPA
jgi:hypothetical protein